MNVMKCKSCAECDKPISKKVVDIPDDEFCEASDADPDNKYLEEGQLDDVQYESIWFDNNHICKDCE